jgi:hypothetical protein
MPDPLQHHVIRLIPVDVPLWGARRGPLDYVSAVMGTVEYGATLGEQEPVAKFSFQHIRVAWAKHDGFPLEQLFAISPDWQALYPLLFDASSERLTVVNVEASASDILFVDEMSVLPEHRGRRLAGTLVEKIASLCFGQLAAVIVRAAPEPVETGGWPDLVYAKPFSATGEAAKKKLRVYWAGFGFRPLGKTEFMIRDAATLEAAPASLRAL